MIDVVREIIGQHGRLAKNISSFGPEERLGLSSFASVQVMIALEERFEIEFADDAIGIENFRSLGTMLRLLAASGVE